MVPEPVDQHAGRERVLRVGDASASARRRACSGAPAGRSSFGVSRASAAGCDRLSPLHRVAAMQAERLVGLGEDAGIGHGRACQFLHPRVERPLLGEQAAEFLRLRLAEPLGRVRRSRWRPQHVLPAVPGRGDEPPLAGPVVDLDPVVRREPVGELPLAVACPGDPVDRRGLRELHLDPAPPGLAGDPAAPVAVASVVQMLQPMDVRTRERARGLRLRARAGEGDVLRAGAGREDLQLVEARFERGRGEHGEAQPLRLDRGEAVHGQAGFTAGRNGGRPATRFKASGEGPASIDRPSRGGRCARPRGPAPDDLVDGRLLAQLHQDPAAPFSSEIQLRPFPYLPSLICSRRWMSESRTLPDAVTFAPAVASATFLPSVETISSSSMHGSIRPSVGWRFASWTVKRTNFASTGSNVSTLSRARSVSSRSAWGPRAARTARAALELGEARPQSLGLAFPPRRRRAQRAFAVTDSGEDRGHRVVIALRDGVELVVVAAGAVDGEAEECGAGVEHHVVQFVLPREPDGREVAPGLPRQQPALATRKPVAASSPVASPASWSLMNSG